MKRGRKTSVPAMEVEVMLDLRCRAAGKANPGVAKPEAAARTARVTRLMALAGKYQEMVDRGELRDYADIARLGYVSRARITQIMNLANLAPDIQEELLFPACSLPTERRLRQLTRLIGWAEQRLSWRDLLVIGNPCIFN